MDGDARLAAMLDAGRVLVHFGMREAVLREQVRSTDPALLDYLLAKFSGMMEEHLVVLFLDGQHKLLSEDFFTNGSPDCLSLRPRALFSRALALGCRAIVLAHNHPSGDPTPSQNDIDATVRIALDAEGLDIKLIDHLIVGNCQVVSMKQAGLI
ncbi:MAG: RadC family protein [Novosphingobium sp.]